MKEKKRALIIEVGNGTAHKFIPTLKEEGFEVIVASKGASYSALLDMNISDITLLEKDLTKNEEVVQLYAYIKTTYGKLDILINNAEIANGFGQKITEINMDNVRKVFEENLFSVMNLIKKLHPLLSKSNSGRIINISSGIGSIEKMSSSSYCYSNYKMTAYSTAKAALEMLTVLLAKEYKSTSVQVSSFDPVRPENCTHYSVSLCSNVIKEFLELIK